LFSLNFMKVLATIFLTVGAIVSYIAFIYGLGISLSSIKNRTA
jgi:glucan phosphoethanolaminetransferase (alkaline phosphatase superfamily)